jgi:hypothetical protein
VQLRAGFLGWMSREGEKIEAVKRGEKIRTGVRRAAAGAAAGWEFDFEFQS